LDPPEEHLYPVLNHVFDDWWVSFRPPFEGIKVVGLMWSPSVCFIVQSFGLWDDRWWNKIENRIGEARRPPQEDNMRRMFVFGFESFTVTAYFNLLFIAFISQFVSGRNMLLPLYFGW
jgi:hypothetical protein